MSEREKMKPYYEHSGVTIFNADCKEILPHLGLDYALVADPPYGIGYSPGGGGKGFGVKTYSGKDLVIGDDKPFDPSHLLCYPEIILWGANHYANRLPPSPTWLVWYKKPGIGPCDFADCELAWSNTGGPARVISHLWNGGIRASEQGVHWHPTQKSLAVMRWVLGFCSETLPVLDPYMGSGTTLVAAKNLNRPAIGIEIEEKYCEIAAKRLSQEVFQF